MLDKNELLSRMNEIAREHGEWLEDIPLSHGVWTGGNQRCPHTRLRRIVQILADVCGKPLDSCRVIDLGCLNGMFSIECALQGARVVGIDVRPANIEKANFAREALGLSNVEFRVGDVRDVRREAFGDFDAVLCSGLLYHLNAPDVFHVIDNIYGMTLRAAVFDTHVSLKPTFQVEHRGRVYRGHEFREHGETDSEEQMEKHILAARGNKVSFWMTRPSLLNALARAGFSSVYECLNPPHLNFGKVGVEHRDRCTFVGLKGTAVSLRTSPDANGLDEEWPEGTLDYSPPAPPPRGPEGSP